MRGRRLLKIVTVLILLLIVCPLVSAGVTLTFIALPHTASDAMAFAEENVRIGHTIYWGCPSADGYDSSSEKICLGITQEEFEMSMSRDVMRNSTLFYGCTYMALADPDDKYVRIIAEYIMDLTEGYSDEMRAKAALNFVQTGIYYYHDYELYGCDEFAATPLETLYLRKGDCEDTSILLMSIYLAMGMDAVVLEYTNHVAVGIKWDGQKDYLYCETATSAPTRLKYGLMYDGEHPIMYGPNDVSPTMIAINSSIGKYRNTIERLTGL